MSLRGISCYTLNLECEIVSQMCLSVSPLAITLHDTHLKQCVLMRRNVIVYDDIFTKNHLAEKTFLSLLEARWPRVALFCKLHSACLRGRVKPACSLELRNVYNKLCALTALHPNWFQMLQQSGEKRTAGSPSSTTLTVKKAICKRKMTFRLWELTKLYG